MLWLNITSNNVQSCHHFEQKTTKCFVLFESTGKRNQKIEQALEV